jgi:hypothetical protein
MICYHDRWVNEDNQVVCFSLMCFLLNFFFFFFFFFLHLFPGTEEEPGVTPRAVEEVFSYINTVSYTTNQRHLLYN